ncbi:Fic family protein [Sediminibacterium salmoneum]|uniref:Fic family protein n=1 Tax=Sediminibacterium salmoneum TaxID=426421 RepID=UPI00047CAC9E|nr:Fic family protein [Sediminibacterium salmoneum]
MPRKLADNTDAIIGFIANNPRCSSQEILDGLNLTISLATLRRKLQELVAEDLITAIGELKSRKYDLSASYNIIRPINVEHYFEKEIDERKIQDKFNLDLIEETLYNVTLFTKSELDLLNNLQKKFTNNSSKLTQVEFQKELERLAIDLSWKSSQIEGNTYSLLETERLLKDKETAAGKTKDEATMLLNHKAAIDFIIEHTNYVDPITVAGIEDIHSILVKELDIKRNIRSGRVGITGTNYTPLDNEYQIKEALESMCALINAKSNVFEKSLLALVLISYIQPFSDGNKRTARIISNAILMNHHYCPISFRTIDSIEYKKAMLVFYEQNNLSPFKHVFINQFEFAVNAYF